MSTGDKHEEARVLSAAYDSRYSSKASWLLTFKRTPLCGKSVFALSDSGQNVSRREKNTA